MLRPVNVSIPLGKGIDESVDPHRKPAPLSEAVENMRAELAGSLRKRPGFASGGPAGSAGANVLVADGARALHLGPAPARIITSEGSTDLSHASPIPLAVTPHRLRAVAGFGHCAQVAHTQGYTATIVSVLGDVTAFPAGSPADYMEHDYACEATIWDADWRPVWGPYRIPELKWLPRVEPILIDENTVGFAFFAIGSDQLTADPIDNGVMTEPIGLYMAQGFPGGSAPTGVLVNGVAPVAFDALARWKIYDTHSTGKEPWAYAAWIDGSAGSYELCVGNLNGVSGGIEAESLGDVARDHSVSIWRDSASDTVLVHHSDLGLLYTDGALSIPFGIVVTPAIDGVGSASTVDDFAGSDYQIPEFYWHGQLYLNEHPITLTGSEPATPSFGPPITPSLAHLYKPQALADVVLYSRASVPGTYGTTARHAELYHLAEHPAYGAPRPQVDLSLLETRWGAETLSTYAYRTAEGVEGTRVLPCVTGQVARLEGGQLLYAMLPLTDQQNPRIRVFDRPIGVGTHLPISNYRLLQAVTAGAGYYNDEQYLCIVEVDPSAPVYSAETHEGTVLVAAGHPSMWSGEAVHPVVPRAPVLSAYLQGDTTPPATRALAPAAVGIADASDPAWGGAAGPVDYGIAFKVKAVLIFTDASGIEYRSAPSEPLAPPATPGEGGVVNGGVSGDGAFPAYIPSISVEIEPSVLPFLGEGRSLDIELYVTERRDAATTEVDESTYTMVCRMPLQRDSDGWFCLDLMQDLAAWPTANYPDDGTEEFSNPPHSKPLYTLSGELPNLPPPTSHVTAQVAGYAFLLPAEAPYEVWSSKPLVKGRSPEWNPALITYAPPACGGIVSLASAYDRLYMLCRAGVWELPVLGGPNALGVGSFGAPQLVYRGQGCISHMGTVETPSGVFYTTKGGPRLLSGSGSVDVGRAVRTAIDWTAVVAATYDPAQDEITWWTTEGSVSYSLRHEAWSTSTLMTRAAAVWEDGVIRLRGSVAVSSVVFESRTIRTDAGESMLGKVTTPWLSFEDIQGFKRVWEVMVLGRIHGGTYGKLRIAIEIDYVETIVDTYDWTLAELGALTKGLQISCKPRHQQVDAIRITVQEIEQDTGKVDQSGKPIYASDIDWTISGINLQLGALPGLMKLQDGAKK